LPIFQVMQIRLAKRAADGHHMKFDIVLQGFLQYAEQVAAKLFPSRAAQAIAPPNGADRMLAAVALGHDPRERLP
jgi:hypothetical protein